MTLRQSAEYLVSWAKRKPSLRALRESTQGALDASQGEMESLRADAARIEANRARQSGGVVDHAWPSHSVEISFLAKFVWGWVLIVLLGLKLAREPFVLIHR